jgi:hypothetical protein
MIAGAAAQAIHRNLMRSAISAQEHFWAGGDGA